MFEWIRRVLGTGGSPRRSRLRQGNRSVPTLESRYLLSAAVESVSDSSSQIVVNRWTQTATNGSGLRQGDATTITWSIADDGTSILGFQGEPGAPSDLIAFLDRVRGSGPGGTDLTQRPWFQVFADAFDRLGQISGLTYVYEPQDDAASFNNSTSINPGVLGVRGDVRIGGHYIDGESDSDTLAYNFFPTSGDMVIDTSNNRFFRNKNLFEVDGFPNLVMHEHGHGLGLEHIQSPDATFLMEPQIDLSFEGPQLYDILGIQRGYGDVLEKLGGNDSAARASNLGTINSGSSVSRGTRGDSVTVSSGDTDFISIDDESDVDFFAITVPANSAITVTLTPRGSSFQMGPVDGPAESVDSRFWADLRLQFIGADGTTLLQTRNESGAGAIETLTQGVLAAGTYYISVSSLTPEAIQLYGISVSVVVNRPPVFNDKTLNPLTENSTLGTGAGTVSATDPDSGQRLTYAITGGNVGGAFSIHSTTGQITVANPAAIDYETTPTFQLTVTATDNGIPQVSDSATITIPLTNLNESPQFVVSANPSAAENSVAVATMTAQDPENAPLTYQITGGGDAGLFQIDSSTGTLTFLSAPDYETPRDSNRDNRYEVHVTASDGTTTPASLTAVVTVTNVNEAPVMTGATRFQFEEYSPRWTVIGRLQATDPENDGISFSLLNGDPDRSLLLTADGTLWVNQQDLTGLRHRGSFSLSVRITDSNPQALSNDAVVDVYIQPVPQKNTQFFPAVDASVRDIQRDGFGVNDSIRTSDARLLVQGGTGGSRSVLEFDLRSLPRDQIVKNAWLFFSTVSLVGGEIINVPLDVMGYAGDGVVTSGDATRGVRIGNRTITNATVPNQLKVHSISLDSMFVQSLSGTGYLGLVLRNETTSDGIEIAASEGDYLSAQKPFLLIQLSDLSPDLLLRDLNGQQFLVMRSNGTGYDSSLVDPFPSGNWERFLPGDFNGDGRTDMAGRLSSDGSWWISLINGSGVYQSATRWGAWSTSATWADPLVADFDGDGRDDLAGRVSNGDWWVSRSTGTALQARLWGNWSSTASWWNVQAADFNRDGRLDIAGRNSQGEWSVSLAAGTTSSNFTFNTSKWGQWSTSTTWSDVAIGDFNGDGRADIVGRSSIGQWWVNRSTGSSFSAALHYGNWSTGTTWADVRVADFDGNGLDDIIGRAQNGQWWLAESFVTQFKTRAFGAWAGPQSQWQNVMVGDANRDGRADLIARNADQNQIWTSLWSSSGLISSLWATLPDSPQRQWQILCTSLIQ